MAHDHAERTYTIPPGLDATAVRGPADRHLKMIREVLGLTIHASDDRVVLRGEPGAVSKAEAVLERLVGAARRRRVLGRDEVLETIVSAPDAPRHDPTLALSGAPAWTGPLDVFASGRPIRPKSGNQEDYLEAIRTRDLVFGIGPAGTGKTYLAVAAAVHMLRIGRVRRLVLARPAVEAGERLGFLPGDLQAKVDPYLRPLLDALRDMVDVNTLQRFTSSDVIEVIPLAFMRGRTLNDAVILLDEAQNTTVGQMMMCLTRIGRQSKCIVTGDVSQIDLPDRRQSGLVDAMRRLRGIPGIAFSSLDRGDIVRHDLVQRIVDAYGSAEERAVAVAAADRSDEPS